MHNSLRTGSQNKTSHKIHPINWTAFVLWIYFCRHKVRSISAQEHS